MGGVDGSEGVGGRSAEHWVLLVGAGLVPVLLVVARVFLEPDERGHGTHEQLGLPACMLMDLWEVPCPGCGVTTAVTLAAHGRVGESLATQPFGIVAALLGLGLSTWALVEHLRGRDLWIRLRGQRLGRGAAIVGTALLLSWIYKIAITV